MKKYLIAVSAAALLASTGAKAADIVRYQPPEPLPMMPMFSWTGFYAGGEIGGAWGNAKSKPRKKKGEEGFSKKIKPDGFIGGLYAGYNFQLMNNIVLGADTDFLWGSVKDSGSKKSGAQRLRIKEKWIGATRLRAGYAFDRFLPYIAAGVSYADLKSSVKDEGGKGGKSKTRTGWNIGLGVDYIPPIMNDHLMLRAEYRYSDFGKKNYSFSDTQKYRVKYNQSDFRVGVAYKF